MVNLGEIESVELRIAWPKEQQDFTPWMAANLALLGEEVALTLESPETEVWGAGRADVLAYDATRDCRCVIENQLQESDNDHLARLLQYAAYNDARTIIWVGPQFRGEHLDTINWLNGYTSDEINFYCVEIRAVKIGDSLPAALFRCVARPTVRPVARWGGRNSSPEDNERNLQFFQPLLDQLKVAGWRKNRDRNHNRDQFFDSGFDGIFLVAGFEKNHTPFVELRLSRGTYEATNRVYDLLDGESTQIELELGIPNDSTTGGKWQRRGRDSWSTIFVYKEAGGGVEEEDHDEIREWMKEYLLKFKEVFKPRLKKIVAQEQADSDEE